MNPQRRSSSEGAKAILTSSPRVWRTVVVGEEGLAEEG